MSKQTLIDNNSGYNQTNIQTYDAIIHKPLIRSLDDSKNKIHLHDVSREFIKGFISVNANRTDFTSTFDFPELVDEKDYIVRISNNASYFRIKDRKDDTIDRLYYRYHYHVTTSRQFDVNKRY